MKPAAYYAHIAHLAGSLDWSKAFEAIPDAVDRAKQAHEHMEAKRWAEAEALLQRACDAEPTHNPWRISLAICQQKQHHHKDAMETMSGWCNTPDMLLVKAAILEELDEWTHAEEHVAAGLWLDADHHGLLFARGMQRLRKGDVAGWADYEHRPPRLKLLQKIDDIPEWDGEYGSGDSISVLAILGQQGIGDQIMFSRWIPEACERWNGNVVIYAHTALVRLFAEAFPLCTVIGSDAESPEDIAAWISIDSLPHVLQSYHAPVVPLAQNIAPLDSVTFEGNAFRVGLCWAGNPVHDRDWLRSMNSVEFATLLPRDARIEYHSLQLGQPKLALDETGSVSPLWLSFAFPVIDNTHLLFDMADTAAYISKLDMVVTVDTAIAHLAGAMGKPCLLLTNRCADWRWSYDAWYKSLSCMRRDDNICFLLENSFLKAQPPTSTITTPDVRTVATNRGPFQIFSADRWISRSLAIYGEWSRGEGDLFEEFVQLGDTIVEAGVNVGWHMLHLAQLAGPAGMVWGFEPNPAAIQLAVQNVFGDNRCPSDSCIQAVALSNVNAEESGFYFDRTHPAGAHVVANGEECKGEAISVPMVKLDAYNLERCDFLKADVEGHELAVLQGAEETIARCRPYLYVENDRPDNSRDLMTWIHAHEYRMYHHKPTLYPGKDCGKPNVFGSIVSGMLFCVPREKFPKIPVRLGLNRVIVEMEKAG